MTADAVRPVRILRIITRLNIGGPSIHAILLSRRLGPPDYESLLVSLFNLQKTHRWCFEL